MGSEKKAVAYQVTYDDQATIVWETSGAAARRAGMNEWGCDFNELSTKRIRELDNGVPDGKTLTQWQLENGWHFECGHCYAIVYEDGGITDGDYVFCSAEHQSAKYAEDLRRQKAAAILSAKALELRPGSIIEDAYDNEHGGVVSLTLPSGRRVTTNLEWLASKEGQEA